jgi:hypothetical protein
VDGKSNSCQVNQLVLKLDEGHLPKEAAPLIIIGFAFLLYMLGRASLWGSPAAETPIAALSIQMKLTLFRQPFKYN